MLAGLQGAGKTTLAGKLGLWLKGQGHSPLLVACDLQRPNAVNQLARRRRARGRRGLRAGAGQRRRRPGQGRQGLHRVRQDQAVRRRHRRHRRPPRHRPGADAAGRGHPRRRQPRRDPLRRRRDDRPGRGQHRRGLPRRRRLRRRGALQARRRRPRWCRAVHRACHRQADHVRLQRREAGRLRRVPPGPHGVPHPRHGRHAQPDREGRADLQPGRGREDGRQAGEQQGPRTSRSTTSWPRWSRSGRWAPSPSCSACCPAWGRSRTRSTTSTSGTWTAPPRSSSR